MAEYDSQVELSIDLSTEDDEAAFKHLLSSLPLEEVVSQTLLKAGIKQPVMLTLLITTDETIRNLNKRYRNQDKSTDVLSFPLLDMPIVSAPADQLWMTSDVLHGEDFQTKRPFVTPPELTMHLGDIVISWPTVIRQAFFFSSRRRHTRSDRDWSSDVCSSDLGRDRGAVAPGAPRGGGDCA